MNIRTDVQAVLDDVDKLLARVKRRIPADSFRLVNDWCILSQFFFRDLEACWSGNVNHFYDAENSFINSVLRTLRHTDFVGSPLVKLAQGLKLIYMASHFRHFMLKVSLPNGQVVIDPFTGQSLSREDLSERYFKKEQNAAQKMQELDDEYDSSTTDQDIPLGLYLQAAKPRDIVVRMLHNLKEIYRSQEDWQTHDSGARSIDCNCIPMRGKNTETAVWRSAELGKATAAVHDLWDVYLSQVADAVDANAIALCSRITQSDYLNR